MRHLRYMLVEGTDGKVHLIYHTSAIEQIRSEGKLAVAVSFASRNGSRKRYPLCTWMISETRTRSSRTLLTSTKKRRSYFAGALVTFRPCGADGWGNIKRSCKLTYETPTEASGRTSGVTDAPRKLGKFLCARYRLGYKCCSALRVFHRHTWP